MERIELHRIMNLVLAIMLIASASVQISCKPRSGAGGQTEGGNPLSKIDPDDIAIARFTGISSPIEGIYFETRDRDLIDLIYQRFSKLAPNNPRIVSMAGNLTTLHLLDSDETILSEIGINGDGSTIVVRGRREALDDFLMTESRETALFTFNFLKEHAPEFISKLRASEARHVQLLHKKSYPIEAEPEQ